MEEMWKEVGVKESFKRNPMRGRLECAGREERMEGTVNENSGCIQSGGGRQRLGWERCVKRHLVGLGWSGERDRKVERVENDDGEGSKTEPVTEEGNTNRRYRCQPHLGLQ